MTQQSSSTETLISEFTLALLSAEEGAAGDLMRGLLARGVSPEGVFEDLFAPAARRLGVMWEDDDCSFYEVTIGSGRIQCLMRELATQLSTFPSPGATGRVILSVAPGEQHTLGTMVVAEHLLRDGWDVHFMSSYDEEYLLDKVQEIRYDCVGLSISCTRHLNGLARDIKRIRQLSTNRDIQVILGGPLVTNDPKIVARVGADGYGVDGLSAVTEARRLCAIS
ncbi:MAG: B12-binding domain-containing protein [Gemmatimonadota bacterium]